MGTRNLVAVVIGGEFKIAQYGQWDGYPSGQGADVLTFLRKRGNIDRLKDSLQRVRFFDSEGQDKEFIEAYNAAAETGNLNEEQKAWFAQFISRDLGAQILYSVASAPDGEILLRNSVSFAGDSLFCEFAYVIDFDKCVFEVYKGFNKSDETIGRFADPSLKLDKTDGYSPVTLIMTYSLFNLPGVQTFIKQVDKACGYNKD